MPNLLYLAIAGISGAAMAFQGTLNTALGKIVGIWESTLIVHVIGTVTALLIIIILGVGFNGFGKMAEAPWFTYLGGVLSVVIIYAVVRAMSEVGVGNATTAIITAQIITAVIVDCTGLFGMKQMPFKYLDILGIVMLSGGAYILFLE